MHRVGSILITTATVPLALGMAGDVYVVIAKIAVSPVVGAVSAGGTLLLIVGLWHLLPLVMRRQRGPGRRA